MQHSQLSTNLAAGRFVDRPVDSALMKALDALLVAATIMTVIAAGAGLTLAEPAQRWLMLLAVSLLLGLWMLWRSARGEMATPLHALHLLLLVPLAIQLAHMLASASFDSFTRHADLFGRSDGWAVVTLVLLMLLMLIVQDVLGRVAPLRTIVSFASAMIAIGCGLRLRSYSGLDMPAWPALALAGLAATALFMAAGFIPDMAQPHPLFRRLGRSGSPNAIFRVWGPLSTIGRLGLAVSLAGLIVSATPWPLEALMASAVPMGLVMLAGAIFLSHHRRKLLLAGPVLLAGGLLCGLRSGWFSDGTIVPGVIPISFWGGGTTPDALASGLEVLAQRSGWAGLAAVWGGSAVLILLGLAWARRLSPGDQARSICWAVSAALAGAALAVEGGLAVPAGWAVMALVWGLYHPMLLLPVRRVPGWLWALPLTAAMLVLGLGANGEGSGASSDDVCHFLAGMVITALLCWQMGCRTWWQGALAAALAAGALCLGEPIQERLSSRSFDWNDMLYDCLGALATLGGFLLIRAGLAIDAVLSRRREQQRRYLEAPAMPALPRTGKASFRPSAAPTTLVGPAGAARMGSSARNVVRPGRL